MGGMARNGEHILSRLKLRDLRILAAVAKAGSMASAARQLSVSQPAVSKAVADLEATLRARLFDRTPHGIEPTIYGAAMLRRAAAALDELSQGAADLEHLSNPEAGELRFNCNEVLASGIVPIILQRLLAKRPGLTFYILPSETPNQSVGHLVSERKVELELGRYPTPLQGTDLEAEFLYNDPLVVVAGRTHLVARRRKLDLAEILHERWILLPAGAPSADIMERVFTDSGLALPRAVIYTTSMQVRIAMLASGHYITMLPASSLRVSPIFNLMTILPIKLRVTAPPVGIVKLKGRTLSPVAELFAEAARKVAHEVMGSQR